MKAQSLKVLGIAAALALGTQVAGAATLGHVQFGQFTSTTEIWATDLGGVYSGMADALVTYNDYNGMATLPNGLPVDYSIHIDKTYYGDGVATNADHIRDKYFFKIDPTTLPSGTANADATLTIATGVDTGMVNVTFKLYHVDQWGNQVAGDPFAQISGAGNLQLTGLTIGQAYVMKVSGYLKTDDPQTAGDQSTDVGQYDIVFGLLTIPAVPVPPAIILLVTAIGALVGFGKARKSLAVA